MFDHLKSIWPEKKLMLGAGAIMLAALFWSLDGTFLRPKFYTLPAPLVVFLEHILGFIILVPFIYYGWQKIKLLLWRDWLAIIWVCFFGGLIGTIMITKAFFAAVDGEVTFATVVILQKLQPVFALFLARITLGEKLSRQFYFWAVIAIVSAYFLSFSKSGLLPDKINFYHNAAYFAIIAAFAFGSSTVFGKRVVNHLDFKTTTALRFGITSFMALIWILVNKDLFQLNEVSNLQWKYLAVIVFSSGAIAMFVYYFGLKRVSASAATICELFWPFSAIILDYLINRNILNKIQIVASLILLLAFLKIVKEGKAEQIIFNAEVINGLGRGRRIGYPTINLNKPDLDIDFGTYLVEAEIDQTGYTGLLHFGTKDTFNEAVSTELFIKDLIPEIKSRQVKIKIKRKIRDIKKFANTQDLKQQIREDVKELKF